MKARERERERERGEGGKRTRTIVRAGAFSRGRHGACASERKTFSLHRVVASLVVKSRSLAGRFRRDDSLALRSKTSSILAADATSNCSMSAPEERQSAIKPWTVSRDTDGK